MKKYIRPIMIFLLFLGIGIGLSISSGNYFYLYYFGKIKLILSFKPSYECFKKKIFILLKYYENI